MFTKKEDSWWQNRIDGIYGKKEYRLFEKVDYENRIVKHKCGNRIKVHLHNFCREKGGNHCSCIRDKTGPKQRTNKEWQIAIDDIHGLGEYKLIAKKDYYHRTIKHKCGNRMSVDLRSFVRKTKGPKCSCLAKKRIKLTKEIHQSDILKSHGSKFTCLKFDANKKCTYQHSCGYKWQTTWRSFRQCTKCPECHKKERANRREKEIENLMRQKQGKDYKILEFLSSGKYGNHVDKLLVEHSCGEVYETPIRSFLNGDNRCPCFGIGVGRPKEVWVAKILYKFRGNEELDCRWIKKKWPNTKIIHESHENKLRIQYPFKNKYSNYYPDFYLPRLKTIIETKSPATMGLNRGTYQFFQNDLFERTQAKAKQCKKLGYKFVLHLYIGKKLIDVPEGWENMSKRKLGKILNIVVD
jgi:hypothetical protein